jgi:hypothetical protein
MIRASRLFEYAHMVGSQGNQLPSVVKAHINQVGAPADDLALLVQPGR